MTHSKPKCRVLLLGLLLVTSLPESASAQKPVMRTSRVLRFEPNVHAPEMYGDELSMQFMLVNLPGAGNKATSWSGEYQLYYIPEADFEKNIKSEPRPKDFAGRKHRLKIALGARLADAARLPCRAWYGAPYANRWAEPAGA